MTRDPDKPDGIHVRKIDEPNHPYPWMFEVTYAGRTYQFAGTPNKCATKRAATARAAWRLRWLRRGEFDRHYR